MGVDVEHVESRLGRLDFCVGFMVDRAAKTMDGWIDGLKVFVVGLLRW